MLDVLLLILSSVIGLVLFFTALTFLIFAYVELVEKLDRIKERKKWEKENER